MNCSYLRGYLPLAGRNVFVGIVHTSLKVYPIFSRLQASYGGSSANSLAPLICPHNAEYHPLRAVYPFLHPLIVFSTILVGGSIVAFALIFSYILLIFIWVACSYCVSLIQPYPCPRHYSPIHYWITTVTTKAAGDLYVLAEQTMGGAIGTLVSLAINNASFHLVNILSFVDMPLFKLSTTLILLSGVFITALCVDWSGEAVTFCNVNYDCNAEPKQLSSQTVKSLNYQNRIMDDPTTTFFVRDIDGNITVYNDIGELSQLQSRIYENTGIPSEFQRLYFGRKLLTDAINDVKDIPSGSNIDMLINLRGGGNNCEICFEKGEYQCIECEKKIFCSDCCTKYHKHPSRSNHKHIILYSDQNPGQDLRECSHHHGTSTTSDYDNDYHQFGDHDTSSEFDISDTPNSSQLFQEASMVMTLAEKFNLTRFRDYQKEAILRPVYTTTTMKPDSNQFVLNRV